MPFVSKKPKLKVSEEELKILRSASQSRTMPLRTVERAKMILGYYKGDTISAIARSLGTHRQKVERTINKVLAFGVKVALEDLHRKGRPRSISSEARAWIISLACSKPKDYGYASELWTNRALTRHIRENCTEQGFPELSRLSGGTVSKILSKSNIKPHKISGYVERRDPEFKSKSAAILHTYKQVEVLREKANNGEDILTAYISYDEKPGIQAIGNVAPDLPPVPDMYPSLNRDHEYKRYGTLSLLAGIDLLTGKLYVRVFNRHRSKEFIEYLKYLDSVFPPEMKLVITLDNHSAHTSKETMEYLLTVPNRFSFVFTPTHASWLNIIECLFSKMARSFLRGIRVSSKAELKERILKYFDELNQMPVVFKWKYKMDEIPGGVVSNVY